MEHRLILYRLSVSFFAIFLLIIPVNAAYRLVSAPENQNMVFQINPGESATGQYAVENPEEQVGITFMASDGALSTEGNFAVKSPLLRQTVLGSWITFENPQITIAQKENKKLNFTITVPENTKAGTYHGAITAIDQNSANRTILPVFVIVPGEKMPSAALESFKIDNNQIFRMKLANRGNTLITAKSTITPYLFGVIKRPEIITDEKKLFMNDDYEASILWKDFFIPGFYTVSASVDFFDYDLLADKTTLIKTESLNITCFYKPELYLFIPILVLLYVLNRLRKKIKMQKKLNTTK